MDILELEQRVRKAKKSLNVEMTNIKKSSSHTFTLNEVGTHIDTLHEFERKGLKNLNEVEIIKIERILNKIENAISFSLN